MKLYFVMTSIHTDFETLEALGVTRGLVSYWETLRGGAALRLMEYFGRHELFVDSGAFAAYTQGVRITAEEYGRFLLDVGPQVYANLDVIKDAAGSEANQRILEGMGLKPLPVFHLGEDLALLDAMLERYDYVALGVAQKQNTAAGKHFVAECFARVVRQWPKRVHGFGITSQELLERFPFYSSDSSAADKAGGYGRVMVWNNGKMSYSSDLGTRPHLLDHGGSRVSAQRKRSNYTALLTLERYVTRLWEKRGVAWKE